MKDPVRLTDIISEQLQESGFRRAFLQDAIRLMLEDDLQTAKAVLVEYIQGTVGFKGLGANLHRTPASLRRLLSAQGKPQADQLFKIIAYLQKAEGVIFTVRVTKNPVAKPQMKSAA